MEDPGKFLSLYLRFHDLFIIFLRFLGKQTERGRGALIYLGVVDRAVGDDGEED